MIYTSCHHCFLFFFCALACCLQCFWPSVLWRCWLVGMKGMRPVKKTERWGAGVVICLEWGADLHMVQLMPLPLTVSCFSKIQIGLLFWYRLTWVVPDKGPLKVCFVCSFVCFGVLIELSSDVNIHEWYVVAGQTYSCLRDVLLSCCRRSLCFPLYRHWQLTHTVVCDVHNLLSLGRFSKDFLLVIWCYLHF